MWCLTSAASDRAAPAMPSAQGHSSRAGRWNPQENVKRVQLANEYLDGAALAGAGGSSMPEAIAKEISKVRPRAGRRMHSLGDERSFEGARRKSVAPSPKCCIPPRPLECSNPPCPGTCRRVSQLEIQNSSLGFSSTHALEWRMLSCVSCLSAVTSVLWPRCLFPEILRWLLYTVPPYGPAFSIPPFCREESVSTAHRPCSHRSEPFCHATVRNVLTSGFSVSPVIC